jgi:hypothetical protein
MRIWTLILFWSFSLVLIHAEPRRVEVFVALCDNASQGIVPVSARIGDGNKPDENLYWGCTDGLKAWFRASRQWKLVKREKVSEVILERLTFQHTQDDVALIAHAYRGREIRKCLEDFETALAAGQADLVAYIGHNGLMDFELPLPVKTSSRDGERGHRPRTGAIVLCCKSAAYFQDRIMRLGGKPLLLTDQFMYPGSFLLHDAVEVWRGDGDQQEMRAVAGKAYARNQKISVVAATGVFTKIKW